MKVVVSRRAEMDMVEIATWIAGDSPRAASRMINRLIAAANGLSRYPLRYPTIGHGGLRKRPVGEYVLLYRVDDVVSIARILHGARDWLSLLDEV
ncbi:type II toxin-antitoxin system RelE/ParE family toxin [soil metagenome]